MLAGLSLFLSLFVMGPVLTQVNTQGIQPYLKGTSRSRRRFTDGMQPLQEFMLKHTRARGARADDRGAGQLPTRPTATPRP